jgi:hypothetical protein
MTTINYDTLGKDGIKWYQLAEGLTPSQLRDETNRLYDEVKAIIEACTDADIVFEPTDPDANDPYAVEGEEAVGWTLGHLVAHITASNEEAAGISSLLARGMTVGGRQRVEMPWREVNTVEIALRRLKESRRMVLAYLQAWPDEPHLDVYREFGSERAQDYFGTINAPASYLMGLTHHHEHIAQIRTVYEQAKAAASQQV